MSYTFRLRFKISERKKLGIAEEEIIIEETQKTKIILRSAQREKAIKDCDELILKGVGYDTKEIAEKAGQKSRDNLTLAFCRLRFPANFGDRAAHGRFFEAGLKMLESEVSATVLNDIHGLQVYSTSLNPKFAKLGDFKGFVTTSRDITINTISTAFCKPFPVSDRKRLAYELFSASMSSNYVDSRFLLLMMAIETLIDQIIRPSDELKQIDELIIITSQSNIDRKASLIDCLRNLKTESVGSAGRRLASRLSNIYMGKSPSKFFTNCYEIRSRLVHGAVPRVSIEDIGNLISDLEQFVCDLICLPD